MKVSKDVLRDTIDTQETLVFQFHYRDFDIDVSDEKRVELFDNFLNDCHLGHIDSKFIEDVRESFEEYLLRKESESE